MAAAAVLPDALVIASDIDRVAVDVAEANVAINGLQGRIECLEAAGFDHPRLQGGRPYDLIFANILKGPLIELAPAMARSLQPGEDRFCLACWWCRPKRSPRPTSQRGFVCKIATILANGPRLCYRSCEFMDNPCVCRG